MVSGVADFFPSRRKWKRLDSEKESERQTTSVARSVDDDFRNEQNSPINARRRRRTKTLSNSFFLRIAPGGFVVDDDGGGYVDIGEEDDWSVAADGVEDNGGGRSNQQRRKGAFFSSFIHLFSFRPSACFFSWSPLFIFSLALSAERLLVHG